MRLAVDLSSILWTCLRVGKDPEGQLVDFKGKKVLVNSAPYAYENAVNSIVATLKEWDMTPVDMILVPEGMNSKAPRLAISKEYKATRDDKPNEEYVQFQILRDNIIRTFKSVGCLVVTQDNAEGDDVLGWLAQNAEEDLMIQTNDGDMSVLNGVNSYGANISVRVNGVVGQNKFGDFPFNLVTLYKATVGDTSDNISGIPGFGPKAWEQLWSRFGEKGCGVLVDLINNGSADDLFDDAKADPFVKRIYDGWQQMVKSYKLAKLYPNWVNTMNDPLQWQGGMVHGKVNDERLAPYAAARRLITAENWESFVPWALTQIVKRPRLALDIETSTPDESDDWLEAQGDPDGVDVIGSQLSGMSLTFGSNYQYTVYIAVDHKDTKCVTTDQLRDFLEQVIAKGLIIDIQNTAFEGPILYQLWGKDWKDNGYHGFIPNWFDTKFSASYVDENNSLGLKKLSKKWLDYDQVDYATTTTLTGPFPEGTGGKFRGYVKVPTGDISPVLALGEEGSVQAYEEVEKRQFKMRELPATHVFDYACDDTVTTAAISNLHRFILQCEHTLDVLLNVEIDASYLHAHAFATGVCVDPVKLAELTVEDRADYDKAKVVLDAYLLTKGWEGTVCPEFVAPISVADIKAAHLIITGNPLETAARTPSKVLHLINSQLVLETVEAAVSGDVTLLNQAVKQHFTGAPVINLGSPKQMQKLMYETLALPVKVYNAPTDAMKRRGEKVGTPKTDNLAITYGLLEADEGQKKVLEALRIMKMVLTRFSLFYDTLPGFIHWKTGRVHSSHNQCATNTRRASSSKPNLQQLSKTEKVEGYSPRVRELYVPHHKNAVIVSLDFSSQELLLMAEWSKDPALVSCFVGDVLTDMHSTTGVGIYNKLHGTTLIYDEFVELIKDAESEKHKLAKKSRALGKAVNFGSQYRIAAKKLSTMLLVIEDEAQAMLDAKAEAFPIVEEWSQQEMEAVKGTGIVESMLGAKRHIRDQIMSSDRYVSSKAPRQALSYRIQGSAAEMTKLAEGRSWKENLLYKYDCEYFAAVHDECLWSVNIEDLVEFIPHAHSLMIAKYANMELPIRSSCSIGWNLGEQVELNGDYSEANIYKALGLTKLKETI
jgi:DNA polymerase family A/5'-3' exonuclease, N-terminal resolvase-like domain